MPDWNLTPGFIAEVRETGAGIHDDNLWSLVDALCAEIQMLRLYQDGVLRNLDAMTQEAETLALRQAQAIGRVQRLMLASKEREHTAHTGG